MEEGNTVGDVDLPPLTARGLTTRRALLDGARAVFIRDGFSSARIVDIAAAAGVATGSFYNYFRSKEDVFREVAIAVIDELIEAPRRVDHPPTYDPVEDIRASIQRYVDACMRSRRLTASIHQMCHVDTELRDYRQARQAENIARAEHYIRVLQGQGVADPTVDAGGVGSALLTMVVNVVYEHLILFETGASAESLVETLTDIWVRAIGLRRE
jgi:AcrR family transcriptional regulator